MGKRTVEDADREKGAKEAPRRAGGSLSRVWSSRKERDVPGTLAIVALLGLGFTVQLTFCRLLLRTARRFIRLACTDVLYFDPFLLFLCLVAFPVPLLRCLCQSSSRLSTFRVKLV